MIKFDHVDKVYNNGVKALDDVNLEIEQGEFVAVIGLSGAGKSTLIRTVNKMIDVTSGTVTVNGTDVSKLQGKELRKFRRKIGMVFQSYDLFPHKTILDNITLAPRKVQKRGKAEAEREAMELLERVGLADRKNDYPRQLSGGQKQRVAIVRALCMHPELLLLDEITAALDPEMVREVLDVVLSLARSGSTMLIVTHEMSFAKAIADRVFFLEQGKIMEESADPESFFQRPQTARARAFLHTFDYER